MLYMSFNSRLAPTPNSFSTIFSYPLKICSTLVIFVIPLAIKPAITNDAPALKSVATTSVPVSLVGPTIVEV